MRQQLVCHADFCACGNRFHKNAEIVELPNGDLFAAWFANPEPVEGELHAATNIYGSRLPAGDDDWEDSRVLVDVPGRAVQPPVLFVGPDERLWLVCTQLYGYIHTSRPFVKRSADNGHTWSDLELLHDRHGIYLKNAPIHVDERGWWVLGIDIDHGVADRPGFLLIPDDNDERPADFPLLVGGDQIAPRRPGAMSGQQGLRYATPVELDDGTLRAYMRPTPGGHLWTTESRDGGVTWTTAEETAIPNPDAGFDVIRTRAGNLVLVDNPVEATIPEGRNHLALFCSEDDGETWPYQVTVAHETLERPITEYDPVGRPDFTYGSLAQAADGTIHLLYEYRRAGMMHVAFTEEELLREGAAGDIVPEIAG